MFKGLRTIPVILDIAKEMEELCPDAWLINFSNPAGMVTEAMLRYSNLRKTVGLCNVPIGMRMGVANLLGVEAERIHIDFAGLNHMVFGLNVYLDGEKITDQVLDRITSGDRSGVTMRNIVDLGWEPDFIKGLRLLPCPYHRYYFQTKKMLDEQMKAVKREGTRAEVVKRLEEELFELYKDPDLAIKPPQLEKRGGAYYSDAACSLIHSLYTNKGDIQPVNVRNHGAIASIPPDSAVEVNCVITKEGPKPIAVGDLPVAVRGLVQQIKSFERVAAEAAVTGDYHTALVAMTINPLVPSDTIAKQLLDEMLEAHREHLPQFFLSGAELWMSSACPGKVAAYRNLKRTWRVVHGKGGPFSRPVFFRPRCQTGGTAPFAGDSQRGDLRLAVHYCRKLFPHPCVSAGTRRFCHCPVG